MSAHLVTVSALLRLRAAEVRAEYRALGQRLDADTWSAQRNAWRDEWRRAVRDAAGRRERVPLNVARSYLREEGPRSIADLRYASNWDDLARAFAPK